MSTKIENARAEYQKHVNAQRERGGESTRKQDEDRSAALSTLRAAEHAATLPEPPPMPAYSVASPPAAPPPRDPALPTAEEIAVAAQTGVSVEQLITTKLEAERAAKPNVAGLTADEIRVAAQLGIAPATLAKTKAAQ